MLGQRRMQRARSRTGAPMINASSWHSLALMEGFYDIPGRSGLRTRHIPAVMGGVPLLVRAHRRRQRHEHPVRHPRSTKPVDARISCTSNFTRASAKTTPRSARVFRTSSGRRGCQVNFGVGLCIQQKPLDRGIRGVDRCQGTVLEILGVGEEQRRVVAIDPVGQAPAGRVS